jgi:hypothetical protein
MEVEEGEMHGTGQPGLAEFTRQKMMISLVQTVQGFGVEPDLDTQFRTDTGIENMFVVSQQMHG